jgi:hypothetical protein
VVSEGPHGLDDLAGPGTVVADVGDLTVLPAFSDSHEHLQGSSRDQPPYPTQPVRAPAWWLAGLAGAWRAISPVLGTPRLVPDVVAPMAAMLLSAALAGYAAAEAGLHRLGEASFGIGAIRWLVLGSIVLNRLMFRRWLPDPLVPTLAIEIAPPAVAGLAYFALHGTVADLPACALGGYTVLMALAQLCLLPRYLRLTFSAGFWAFTSLQSQANARKPVTSVLAGHRLCVGEAEG